MNLKQEILRPHDQILVELVTKTYQGEGIPLTENILLEIKKASDALNRLSASVRKDERRRCVEEIEKFIKDWRKVSRGKETPFYPPFSKDKESFDNGWKLAINRMCNELDAIQSLKKGK